MTDEDDDWPTPRSNPDLMGHEAAENILLEAWKSKRFPHAWLVTGPQGVGKATLAFRFARFMLAGEDTTGQDGLFGEELPDLTSDLNISEDHPVFRRVASEGHADLTTIRRTINPDTKKLRRDIVVADVRAAGRSLRLTPGEAGWRIIIVDSADEMNPSAANAILKMLEEPPARTVFFLLSHAPGRLLPTIRSRCRRLRLEPLDSDTTATLLTRYLPELSEDDRVVLAALGEGSIGAALRLEQSGGLALYREIIGLLGQLRDLNIAGVHALGDKLARGEGFVTFTWLLSGWMSRLISGAARGQSNVNCVPGEGALMTSLAATANLAQWMEVWDKVNQMLTRAERVNLDQKQVVVGVFLALQAVVAT
jgi:DNA polymerase III subunit delta'